jgi:hypothetical protein
VLTYLSAGPHFNTGEYLTLALPRMSQFSRHSALLSALIDDDVALAESIVQRYPQDRDSAIKRACITGNFVALERFAWNTVLDWNDCLSWAVLGAREEMIALCLDHGANPAVVMANCLLRRDVVDWLRGVRS